MTSSYHLEWPVILNLQVIQITCNPDKNLYLRFSVTWMKGLKDITTSMRSYKEKSDDYMRMTLKRITVEDSGTYCILAKNCYGCDRAFFTVKLRDRARSLTPVRSQFGFDVHSYHDIYRDSGKSVFL